MIDGWMKDGLIDGYSITLHCDNDTSPMYLCN